MNINDCDDSHAVIKYILTYIFSKYHRRKITDWFLKKSVMTKSCLHKNNAVYPGESG